MGLGKYLLEKKHFLGNKSTGQTTWHTLHFGGHESESAFNLKRL